MAAPLQEHVQSTTIHGRAAGRAAGLPASPLQPLSQKQIQTQASRTIAAAYKPQFQGLNQQSTQEKALKSMQDQANQYYQQWLDTKSKALQANQAQVDAATNGLEQQIISRTGAPAPVANMPTADSALGQNAAVNSQGAQQLIDAASKGALDQEANARAANDATLANTGAAFAGGVQKQNADFATAMQNLANARTKLSAAQTADTQKEIARLQGVNINLAQANRNYQLSANALGIRTQDAKSQIAARNAATKLAQFNANPNNPGSLAWSRYQAQASRDNTYQLDVKRYGLQAARDKYERDNGLGPYRPSKGGTKPPLSQISQNAIYRRIDSVTNKIDQLIQTYGVSADQAYHLMQHGGYVQGPPTQRYDSTTGTYVTGRPTQVHIAPTGEGTQILNAAFNLRPGGSGLTSGDIKALKAMGLATPGRHYGQSQGVPSRSQISPGGRNSPH